MIVHTSGPRWNMIRSLKPRDKIYNMGARKRKQSSSSGTKLNKAVEPPKGGGNVDTGAGAGGTIGLFALYSRWLETHPLTTKGVTSGLIAVAGDCSCQFITYRRRRRLHHQSDKDGGNDADADAVSEPSTTFWKEWDGARTARFGTLGVCLIAPVTHHWYGALMTRFFLKSSPVVATVQRVTIDQTLFNVWMNVVWLSSLMTLEDIIPSRGHHHSAQTNHTPLGQRISQRLHDDLADICIANAGLWVPAQAINFGMVPTKFQVLFGNMVGFVWCNYLSWKAGSGSSGSKE